MAQSTAPVGGGVYDFKNGPCISDQQREEIKQQIIENKKKYNIDAALQKLRKSNLVTQFIWPVVVDQESPFLHSEVITNYVDQDMTYTGSQYGASNLDYNCGNRSYDTTNGYNHAGVDIATWPFPWYLYERDLVRVVAAADGVILNKIDGNTDQQCDCSNFNANSILLEHADGSTALYLHLKLNGLTSKSIGQTVAAGEFLGYMASSGCSSGPHLHFEVFDQNNNLIDPYAGTCNSLNPQSWWQNQPAYLDTRLNAVKTHSAAPDLACPSINEEANFSNCFQAGDRVYVGFYYKDQPNGAVSNMRLLLPNQTEWASWDHTSPSYYPASYWYWYWNLPSNGPFGMWTVEVDFQGQTYAHQFHYEAANYSGILPVNGIQSTSRDVETDGFIQSIQTITAPAVVDYDARTCIELMPFFEVQQGAIFHAFIDGCGGIY